MISKGRYLNFLTSNYDYNNPDFALINTHTHTHTHTNTQTHTYTHTYTQKMKTNNRSKISDSNRLNKNREKIRNEILHKIGNNKKTS